MKKIKLSILSLGIFFASAAIAQDHKPQMNKEQRMEKHLDHLASELNLSAAQREQIVVLNKQSFEKSKTVRNDASLDEAAKKAAMKSVHQEKKAEMTKILSEEQALKLKKLRAEHRANRKKDNARKHTKKDCHNGSKDGVRKDCKMKDQKIEQNPALK